MRNIIFFLSVLVSLPIGAQNWAPIGNFNHGVTNFTSDTVSDELIIIGRFSQYNSDTIAGIGRWNGTSMASFGCGVDWDCISYIYPPGFYPVVNGAVRYHNDIYLTGAFNYAGNHLVSGLTKWDGNNWNHIGTGLKSNDGSIGIGFGLKEINNELFVFGVFDSVAGIPCNSLAKFDGANWSTVSNLPIITISSGNVNRIYDIAYYNSELYLCGTFYNDTLGFYNIIKWDGTNWVSVGPGIRGNMVFIESMCIYNNELYIAGMFQKSQYAGNPGDYIAKWNGTQWSEVGGSTDGIVRDLQVHDGYLYACGNFKHAGGVPADGLARWDGTNWCGFGTVFDNVVSAIGFYHDTLYIGGGFWTINGDSINYVAKWTGGSYTDTCGNMTGVQEVAANADHISIYPNPASESVTIQFNINTTNGFEIDFYNYLGARVLGAKVNSNTGSVTLNTSGMAKGMYLYQVTSNGRKIYSDKLIIIK